MTIYYQAALNSPSFDHHISDDILGADDPCRIDCSCHQQCEGQEGDMACKVAGRVGSLSPEQWEGADPGEGPITFVWFWPTKSGDVLLIIAPQKEANIFLSQINKLLISIC